MKKPNSLEIRTAKLLDLEEYKAYILPKLERRRAAKQDKVRKEDGNAD